MDIDISLNSLASRPVPFFFWSPTSSTSWSRIGDTLTEGCGTSPVASVTEVLSAKAVQWGLSKTLFDRLSEKQLPMLLDTQLL